jgi:hypothetical protein
MAAPRPSDARDQGSAARPSRLSASTIDSSDWPAQAADTIERVVQGVRDKTTGPAITAVRWLVASVFLVLAGTMVAILLAVALVRLVDVYLPDSVFGEDHVWAAHGLVGLLLALIGLVMLSKRRGGAPDES